MQKITKRITFIIPIIIIILLVIGGYRASVDKTSFLTGFDYVTTTLLWAVWQLVNNPVILIAIAIVFVIRFGGKNLEQAINRIRTLKFGNLTFELYDRTLENKKIKSKIDKTPDEFPLEQFIGRLRNDTLRYLYDVDGKNLGAKEHVRALAEAISWQEPPYHAETVRYYLLGIIASMKNFEDILLEIHRDGELLTIRLLPNVRELIEKKLALASSN